MDSKSALDSKTGKQQSPFVMASGKKRVVAEYVTDSKLLRPPSTVQNGDKVER